MEAISQPAHRSAAARTAPQEREEPGRPKEAGRWFGFFVEPMSPRRDGQPHPLRGKPAPKRAWIQCAPTGISYLTAAPGEPPRLLPTPPRSPADSIALEPIYQRGRAWLLMRRPSREIRVNGAPALRIATLSPGDQVQASDEYLLYVSLFTRPYVGPRPDEHADKTCLYCRGAFPPGSMVLVCPFCQGPLHCQGEEQPADVRLECARLISECPTCHMPLRMEEGFAYVPE
jgi:hypothetical protein